MSVRSGLLIDYGSDGASVATLGKVGTAGRAPLEHRRSPHLSLVNRAHPPGKPGTAGTAPLAHRRTPTTAKAAAHSSPKAIATAHAAGVAQAAATAKKVAAANAKAHPKAKPPAKKPAPKSTGHSIAQGHTGSGSHAAGAPHTSSPAPSSAPQGGQGIDLIKLLELAALGAAVFLLIVYLRRSKRGR